MFNKKSLQMPFKKNLFNDILNIFYSSSKQVTLVVNTHFIKLDFALSIENPVDLLFLKVYRIEFLYFAINHK